MLEIQEFEALSLKELKDSINSRIGHCRTIDAKSSFYNKNEVVYGTNGTSGIKIGPIVYTATIIWEI